MGAGQTRVSDTSGDYGSKAALGSDAMELFTIPVEGSATAYLQLRAELQDTDIAGDLSQTITLAVSCDTMDDTMDDTETPQT